MADYNQVAFNILTKAIETGVVTRTDYNYARSIGALMTESVSDRWNMLNRIIRVDRCRIIEDGDVIFAEEVTNGC